MPAEVPCTVKLAWPLPLVVALAGEIEAVPEGLATSDTVAPTMAVPELSRAVTTMVALWPTDSVAEDPPLTVNVVCAGSGAVASIYSLSLVTIAFELPL